MSIYYKYEPDGYNLVVLSYVDLCVYWYTSEELGKLFLVTLVNRFHVKFLVYVYWFMSIIISALRTIIFQWIKLGMIHLLLQSI